MPPKKGGGKSKGKQPVKKLAPKRAMTELSSSDDEKVASSCELLNSIAGLEQAKGGPVAGSGKAKTQRSATPTSAPGVLTQLSALERPSGTDNDCKREIQESETIAVIPESATAGPSWASESCPIAVAVDPVKGDGKPSTPQPAYAWPWGPWGHAAASGPPGSVYPSSAPGTLQVLGQAGGWPASSQPTLAGQYGGEPSMPHAQAVTATVLWPASEGQTLRGMTVPWQTFPGAPWTASGYGPTPYGSVPFGALPFGDTALSLGDHLTQATRDKILKGEYIDVFTLLFRELEKDKEDLDERDKERLKSRRVARTWANWLPGFLIYAGVLAQAQPWRAASLFRYLDIIYKGHNEFVGAAWLQYDEEFRKRAALNPGLRWDQIHQQLWLQVMFPAKPSRGYRSDSGHLVH